MDVTILSTSDVHGYFMADDFRRPLLNDGLGLTRAATAMKMFQAKAGQDRALVTIENGDFIQGSPLTDFIQKEQPEEASLYQQLAQQLQYDVRILGNHEFNYGRAYLETLLGNDPLLVNANILDQATGQPFIGQPYRIIERKGLKIGVIGLTTSYIPHWEQPQHIAGLTFADPVTTARRYIQELRPQVDVLVLAYHGGFARDLETGAPIEPLTGENQGYELLQLEGIDALVTGHQHRQIAAVVNQVPTTQPGYRADHLGVIELRLDQNHQVTERSAHLLTTKDFKPNHFVNQVVSPIQQAANLWLDQVVGQVGNNMAIQQPFLARVKGHPFLTLVNQAQMAAGHTQIAATALFNDEVRGLGDQVTRRDIMTNYIYPNTLVVESLSGQDIKDALEINAQYFQLSATGALVVNPRYLEPKVQHYNYDVWTGLDYTFDYRQPVGQRVTAVSYQGQPLNMVQHYEVAMNNYRANGAGGFPMYRLDKVVREVQQETPNLISDYIREHPNLDIPQPTNLTIVGYKTLG